MRSGVTRRKGKDATIIGCLAWSRKTTHRDLHGRLKVIDTRLIQIRGEQGGLDLCSGAA